MNLVAHRRFKNQRTTYISIINILCIEEVCQLHIVLALVLICGQVATLNGLSEMIVEEIQQSVPVDEILLQGEVERRPDCARYLWSDKFHDLMMNSYPAVMNTDRANPHCAKPQIPPVTSLF